MTRHKTILFTFSLSVFPNLILTWGDNLGILVHTFVFFEFDLHFHIKNLANFHFTKLDNKIINIINYQ